MSATVQPLSPALLTALLESERALGRLAEVVQDPTRRRRLWADAARRESCAAARLDGVAVDPAEFLVATIGTDLVPTAGRGAAQSVRALWQGALFTQGVIAAPARHAGNTRAPIPSSGAAADAWRAVAQLEAGSDVRFSFPPDDEDGDATPAADDTPPAWTLGWAEALWRCLQAEVSGRDPGRLAFSADREAEAATLLKRLDQAGDSPALLGGVGMLAELLRPAPDLRIPAWAVPSARLMAALAVARCCRVPNVWLPMSVSLHADRTTAGLAACGREEGWRLWLADTAAETARRERERALSLDRTAEGWQQRVGAKRRNSRTPDLLELLFEEPALTVRRVQKRLGSTFRGAQLLVDELLEVGILREATNRALDRVFIAVDLMP
ncbi:hypothetical protein ABAZ39_20780 (plasmid) [Azospirillum argentinense]|uniref:DUF1403 family protein n=1 Tax=Azospirillum argentinense TaxID=2970906 RepID=A0A060DNP7_9PROT|nr:hypothetical protein [Azospirillum argentinense]AIB14355.1 hypothetical protein ABAZ39_20780 [Azospirillum argentinense]EZQ06462.1 hypothetical protein ABAZ39_17320 [Azospirillum argentinense]PNQ94886.1 hypothetical protein C1S70_31835 [Azospirillum argentinense]